MAQKTQQPKNKATLSTFEVLGVFAGHLRVMVLVPVVFALVAALYSVAFMPSTYTAVGSIYVKAQSSGGGVSQAELGSSQLVSNDLVQMAKSDWAKAEACMELGVADEENYTVGVSNAGGNRIVRVSVTGPKPAVCADLADTLTACVGDMAARLMDVRDELVFDTAVTPTSPSGPNRLRIVLVAMMSGLVLAALAVLGYERMNNVVRGSADVGNLLGIPVIGSMPVMEGER